ncbi:multidrug effflux MFS transporter [Pararhodobacter aggregans]|uniref:Bcr/CflA family efflux transporter n=1 Tax=Pararhodobacter aggregans TaxID=404875 RepID=A0A2T7UPV4_9RHOB|nr:multidrug effflux MFS transporter [Pararhodobacter aggregans]PTX01263.1 DHA1 family bicyclomycin/chloramphenicol resistance-like MFS transporter [Pararhodobacter aggregans]PVE46641.1 multidrug MFS transporter [Pararhodobacter aggregans]
MTGPTRPLPFGEFIALLALLMATVAYSVDAMLPLLDPIGRELAPATPENAQLVITVFMFGLGLGTFVMGPLSDALGRKSVILGGITLYMVAAGVAAVSNDLTMLLVARFVHGVGCAAPRVVAQALVRDLYSGRQMARVISFGMTIFTLFPAVAPYMGAELGALFGWRAIFWSFIAFGIVSFLWMALRQPETLAPENRRPLALGPLWRALVTVLSHARVRLYLMALTFVFATMLTWLSAVAAIFDQSFGRLDQFPAWFALVALLSGTTSLINAKLVVRLGMRRLIGIALSVQIAMVAVTLLGFALDLPLAGFGLFITFMALQFLSLGFLIGNMNALALEPMGHVAGMAASVIGGVSTVVAAVLAAGLTLLANGTPVPLAASVLGCLLASGAAMLAARRYAD